MVTLGCGNHTVDKISDLLFKGNLILIQFKYGNLFINYYSGIVKKYNVAVLMVCKNVGVACLY